MFCFSKIDVLMVHPNGSKILFQELSRSHSARETPIWCSMLANHCRSKGFGVQILDCEAEVLDYKQSAKIIKEINPRVACIVVYGQNPNASTQNMEGAVALANEIKLFTKDIKILFVGAHVAALPMEVLALESVDFVCQNEGVYTISNLLMCDDLNDHLILEKIKGLGWKRDGHMTLNPINPIVPQDRLEYDLPGVAWDLLPDVSKYRTSHWHAWTNNTELSPFASLYTSLGCKYQCFPQGTKIIVSNGANRPIQKIQVGDKLIGYDEKTGKLAETTVMKFFEHDREDYLIQIKFENGRTIKCTDEHPFYVHGKWIEAKDLKAGDEIHHMTFNDKIAFHKHLYNPSFTSETKKLFSERTKEAFRTGKLKNNFADPEWHKKHPPFSTNPEGKKENYEKQSKRMKENNPMFKEDIRKKVSKTTKGRIADGTLVPFMMTEEYWKTLEVSPNKMEQEVYSLLEENFPGEWEFVGDGSVRFDYYSPDFININGKNKIIEFHGCYWHKCSKCHPEFEGVEYKRDADRIKTYEKHGYKTLEIWQHELDDKEALLKKIGDFLYNGIKVVEIKKYGLRKPIKVYNFECSPHNNYFVGLSRGSGDYILSHNCSFCMINIINRVEQGDDIAAAHSNTFRYWNPDFIIKQFDEMAKRGVKNVKIADELFVYMPRHFMRVCELLIERDYGFNIWCYSRVDTCKPEYLETLKKAGVNWLGIGVENPDQTLRKEVHKSGFKEVKINDLFKMMNDAGICVGANYIYGLPMDTKESMKYTADFMMENLTENMNLYVAQALPGSPLHLDAKRRGMKLPDRYAGFSQHSWHTMGLSTDNLTSEEIQRARDDTWMRYFTNPTYLTMMEKRFGAKCSDSIKEMTSIKLKRKLFGDPEPI